MNSVVHDGVMAGRTGWGGDFKRIPLWLIGAVALVFAAVSFSLSAVASTTAHTPLPAAVTLHRSAVSTPAPTVSPQPTPDGGGSTVVPPVSAGVVPANRPVVTQVNGSTEVTVPELPTTTTTTVPVTTTTDDSSHGGHDNSSRQ